MHKRGYIHTLKDLEFYRAYRAGVEEDRAAGPVPSLVLESTCRLALL